MRSPFSSPGEQPRAATRTRKFLGGEHAKRMLKRLRNHCMVRGAAFAGSGSIGRRLARSRQRPRALHFQALDESQPGQRFGALTAMGERSHPQGMKREVEE